AETLFKLGWRSVQDLADAVPEELASVPGLGGLEAARRIGDAARGWLAEERQRQIAAPRAAQRRAALTDDQKLLEIKGLDSELLPKLRAGGYSSVELLAHETDVTRVSEAAEIDSDRAAELIQAARVYLGEMPGQP